MGRTFVTVSLVLILCNLAVAQTRPARPGNGRGLDQLRSALQNLDLSPEQRSDIRAALGEAREKMQQALREKGDAGDAREQVIAELRSRMAKILTPAQQQALHEAMGDSTPKTTSEPARKPSTNASVPVMNAPQTIHAGEGDEAPNFTLARNDGPSLTLSQFKGKIVLVVFAAYSSPTFRQHAPQLEQLRRDLGTKATELVIYTREPHAKGEWEIDRNKDAGIEISQAKTLAERSAMAKQMQQALKLTVPVVVDAIDNTTASAYGAESDTALLIGRDGTILFRQKWFDPYGMRRAIDEALANSKP